VLRTPRLWFPISRKAGAPVRPGQVQLDFARRKHLKYSVEGASGSPDQARHSETPDTALQDALPELRKGNSPYHNIEPLRDEQGHRIIATRWKFHHSRGAIGAPALFQRKSRRVFSRISLSVRFRKAGRAESWPDAALGFEDLDYYDFALSVFVAPRVWSQTSPHRPLLPGRSTARAMLDHSAQDFQPHGRYRTTSRTPP